MSQANIPNVTPSITVTRDDALNLLLASIAIEELGLGHIINAEAEKIQYAVGTLPGLTVPSTINDLIAVNSSVKSTMQELLKKEMLLQHKLESVLGAVESGGGTGTTGATGPTGPTGATGAPGAGAVIPYASGLPVTLTTVAGGLVGTVGLIGFGSSVSGVSALGGTIDLTGVGGNLLNFAFSAPRAGTITDIAAFFSTTVALNLIGSTVTITAQLYRASPPSNTFVAIPGGFVTLAPALSGAVAVGATSNGLNSGLAIPVAAEDRLLLAFEATASGLSLINLVVGYAGAGITIN
ncbi:exosporium glycoprotein BclB-related protein [Paenibacillus sp. F411]|uniref:exosporium glycoprotein BclB-related protein n=1 Tax=Paenibacillus sp. F411 TaxID=2820239 RepID=UPI001FBA2047|nr:exosporium glycoprotein BclB-related protein [Paenibacillus sp. F411]